MNAKIVWNQFVRIIISALFATAIAILVEHRYESWWVGATLALPIGILLCDLRKSWQAAAYFVEHGLKFILVPIQCIVPLVISVLAIHSIVDLYVPKIDNTHFNWPDIYMAIVCCLGVGVMIHIDHYRRKLGHDSRTLVYFPITRTIAAAQKLRSERRKQAIHDSAGVFSAPVRNASGDILTWSGIFDALKNAWNASSFFLTVFTAGLLSPLFVLDAALTAGFKVITSESVSAGSGAVIGFSVDYFYGPATLSGEYGLMWLVVCCVIGALAGCLAWFAKSGLDAWRPAWMPAVADPHGS